MRFTYLTVTGNLTSDPTTRHTKDGVPVTEFGLAHNHRKQDRATGLWEDAEPTYYTVTCWRRLAEGVGKCLHKGDPVVVHGKFTTREYERTNGQIRSQLKIEAEAVGPDLYRVDAAVLRRTTNTGGSSQSSGTPTPHLTSVPDVDSREEDDPFAPTDGVEPALADALPGGSE